MEPLSAANTAGIWPGGVGDTADENAELVCRCARFQIYSAAETIEINKADGRALLSSDGGGFAGAAEISDGSIVVALPCAWKFKRGVF